VVFKIGDERHDAVQWLMLPGPAPVPGLKVSSLGQSEEAMDVFPTVNDDTVPIRQLHIRDLSGDPPTWAPSFAAQGASRVSASGHT
jgi:hypothetical protein